MNNTPIMRAMCWVSCCMAQKMYMDSLVVGAMSRSVMRNAGVISLGKQSTGLSMGRFRKRERGGDAYG